VFGDRAGRRLQSGIESTHLLEHGGGNRKNHTGWTESSCRQDMMQEKAVEASISIVEWVQEDETESGHSGGYHGMDFSHL
jgi:hypothetical protein